MENAKLLTFPKTKIKISAKINEILINAPLDLTKPRHPEELLMFFEQECSRAQVRQYFALIEHAVYIAVNSDMKTKSCG